MKPSTTIRGSICSCLKDWFLIVPHTRLDTDNKKRSPSVNNDSASIRESWENTIFQSVQLSPTVISDGDSLV